MAVDPDATLHEYAQKTDGALLACVNSIQLDNLLFLTGENKMKHISTLFLLPAILSLFLSFNVHAADSYPEKAGEKLATGVANIVTGIGEIPKT